MDIEVQDTGLYKTFFAPFDKWSIKTKNVTNVPKSITQSEAPALKVIGVNKIWTDISVNSGLIVETSSGLTEETRVSLTPEHAFQKRKEI